MGSSTRLLKVAETSEARGIPYGTLLRLIHSGELPAVKLPGRRSYLIDPDDLDELIEASKTGTVAGTKLRCPTAKTSVNGNKNRKLKAYPSDWYKTG